MLFLHKMKIYQNLLKLQDTNVNITEKMSNMFNLNVADNFSIYDNIEIK